MRSREALVRLFATLVLSICVISCGGSTTSSSVTTGVNNPNPVPSISSISPFVIAAGAPTTTVALTGTKFLPSSVVNIGGTPLATNFVSSTQVTANIPAADLVNPIIQQITVSNPAPGGGTSPPQSLTVKAVGSVVLIGAPSGGGAGTGPWQLSIAVVDSLGNPITGIGLSIAASNGSLSASAGITDNAGTLTTSVSPPPSYSGQAIAVTATTGSQTAAVNIAFVPSTFNPAANARSSVPNPRSSASGARGSTAFVLGTSAMIGIHNPFATSDPCYTNVGLSTAPSSACQNTYSQNSVQQTLVNVANTVCSVSSAISQATGIASCLGTAGIVGACLASETGIGAILCDGTVEFLGTLGTQCLTYLASEFAQAIFHTKLASDVVDFLSFEPDSTSPLGVVGLVCDAVDVAEIGTGIGSSGVQVSLNPGKALVPASTSINFTSAVSGTTNTAVDWSVNGVSGGAGAFGTIDTTGSYVAPASVPRFQQVTVTATSVADPSASASAVVTLIVNSVGTIRTIVGNGTAGWSGDGGAALGAQLSVPTGIAFDGGQNMFIADAGNNVIRRVDASSNVITSIAGTGTAGFGGDGGPGTLAQFNLPTHVAFDRTVNLFVTDANNERIRKVDSVSDIINTVAGTGIAGYSGDGGPATSAQLNFPDGVALDSNGNIFIGDALNNRVREIDITSSNISTVAGNGIAGFAGDGGNATSAELNFPSRPYVDGAGNIYIADYQNNRIRRVDAATGTITTVAGNGTAGYSGDGGTATNAQLNGPLSVALDSTGNIFIADINNARIRVVNTTMAPVTVLGVTIQPGDIQTVVGTGIQGYSGDGGPAVSAYINFPTGLTIDSAGNLFFADAHNNVIREVTGP